MCPLDGLLLLSSVHAGQQMLFSFVQVHLLSFCTSLFVKEYQMGDTVELQWSLGVYRSCDVYNFTGSILLLISRV